MLLLIKSNTRCSKSAFVNVDIGLSNIFCSFFLVFMLHAISNSYIMIHFINIYSSTNRCSRSSVTPTALAFFDWMGRYSLS